MRRKPDINNLITAEAQLSAVPLASLPTCIPRGAGHAGHAGRRAGWGGWAGRDPAAIAAVNCGCLVAQVQQVTLCMHSQTTYRGGGRDRPPWVAGGLTYADTPYT